MPRRTASTSVQQAAASASTSAPAPAADDPVSQNIAKLRKTWKFAALCQFIITFEEAFGLSGFKSEALEHDLAAASYAMVPDLMKRLLYTLTLDKHITLENWQDYLRSQYQRRLDEQYKPAPNPLGTAENPKAWESLSLPGKVRTIHDLCEWQLGDAERFRKLLRSEEDPENWRVYPIGFDAQDNTYWLFDDNRLWVQHPPPPKPKAKPPPKKNSKKAKAEAAAARKKAAAEAAKQKQQQQKQKQQQKRQASFSATANQDTPNKRARTGRSSAVATNGHTPTRGTRSSRRSGVAQTNGDGDDDNDQANIPAELRDFLKPPRKAAGAAQDDEDESELSDTPGDEEADDSKMDVDIDADESVIVKDEEDEADEPPKVEDEVDPDEETWVEYETVAVTKAEWEAIRDRFAKSKHPDEKALHVLLRDDYAPRVLNDIAEAEKAAALEAALASRKRSSRIAMKESEKEEKERELQARLEMEERMKAIRKEEEDRKRKEEEAFREERKREERLREREERIRAREQEAEEKAIREVQDRERKEKMREMRQRKREMIASGALDPSEVEDGITKTGGSSEADDEDWDLRCEICHKAGRNPELAPGEEIVCCESCMVWQHTKCWDAFDVWTQRPTRVWDEEDFFCTDCKAKRSAAAAGPSTAGAAPSASTTASNPGLPPAPSAVNAVSSPATAATTPAKPAFDKAAVRSQIEAYRRAKGMPLSEEEKQKQRTKKIILKRSASGTPGGATPGAGSSPKSHSSPVPSSVPGAAMSPSTYIAQQSPIPPAGQPSHPYSSRPMVPTSANGGTPNKPLLGPNLAPQGGVGPSAPYAQPYHGPTPRPLANGMAMPGPSYGQPHPLRHAYVPSPQPGSGYPPQAAASPSAPQPRPSMGAPPVPSHPGVPYTSNPPAYQTQARSPPISPGPSNPRPLPNGSSPSAPSPNGLQAPSPSANGPAAHRPTSSSGSSTSKGPTGSFPIRRPNSSVARSPLSGPSISPGAPQYAGGSVPQISLGEAVQRGVRNESPTPGAGASLQARGNGGAALQPGPLGSGSVPAQRVPSPLAPGHSSQQQQQQLSAPMPVQMPPQQQQTQQTQGALPAHLPSPSLQQQQQQVPPTPMPTPVQQQQPQSHTGNGTAPSHTG